MKSRTSRFYFGILAMLAVAVGLHSCTKADITFGDQWVENGYSQVNMVDTFAPQMSTIYVDTFPTNGTGYSLIGVYKDPALGVVKASTYMRLQPPAVTNGIIDSLAGAVYDSAVVYLKLKNNEYGDTTQNMTLNVYQLAKEINYYDNTSNLYNNTSFDVNSTPIGTRTFTLNPNIDHRATGDTLLIRLSDVLGQDLFEKVRKNNPIIQNTTDFLTYFKGVKISASATDNNGFMFNAADSASIRIYYTVPGVGERIRQYTEFTLNNSAYQFNNISIDRSSTALGNAGIGRLNRDVPSTSTGHLSYLQQSTQTAIKLTFPSVKNIVYRSNYLRLVKAVLTVAPQNSSYLPYYAVPSALYVAPTANYNNGYTESMGIPSAPYLDPSIRQYSYTFDITSYINSTELATEDLTGRGLVMFVPASVYKSSIGRLIVGDIANQKNNKGGIKLQLYYLSVQ